MMDVRAAVASALHRTTLAQLVEVTLREYEHNRLCAPFVGDEDRKR
jgi:hypothetical protein